MPESMRQMLAMQTLESGKPFPSHLLAQMGDGNGHPKHGGIPMHGDCNGSNKVGMYQWI